MDTNKKIREHISALSDGELSESDIELAFAALNTGDGHHTWDVYHRIGDVMRAQASPDLSPGFSSRLASRLAAEPMPIRRRAESPAEIDAKPAIAVAQRG
jgi:sigma-E factor negative regulatory protein RseA